MRFLIRYTFIFLLLSSLTPITVAEFDWKNIKCACVGSKTPAQKDYQIIRSLFPKAEKIQRLLFKEKLYYILIKNRKIDRVLSGWETGIEDHHIWLVLDRKSRLLEVVRYPLLEHIPLKKENVFLNARLPENAEDYFEAVRILHADLNTSWDTFVKRVRLNIYKSDAVSQATP